MEEINFKNRFNDVLFGTSWEIESPKAIVVIVTGMAEHSRRYDDFAKFLNSNYYSVYCIDHYGQGVGKMVSLEILEEITFQDARNN